MALEQWTPLNDESGLKAGDEIVVTVRPSSISVLRNIQLDAVEQRIRKDPRLEWMRLVYPRDKYEPYQYFCRVVDPNASAKQQANVVLTAGAVVAIIAAVLLIPATILVYRVTKSAATGAAETAKNTGSILTSIAAIVGGWYAVKWLGGH